MRSRSGIYLLALFAVSTSAIAADTPKALDEVVIADMVDFTNAIAFYVDAPTDVQRGMALATQKTVKANQKVCTSEKEPHWLCTSKQFRFFRGITGTGEKSRSGYVCVDESWVTRHKYYPEAMMVSDGCIQIEWDEEKRAYELLWPEP